MVSTLYSDDKLRYLEVFFFMGVTASSRGAYCWVPLPSGLSQNCWKSSSSYSLVVVQVLLNRLCRLLWEVLISVLALLPREVELLLGEACPFLEVLFSRHVLSPLGYEVLPRALTEIDRHLLPLLFRVVDFGSHEGL